MYNIGDTVWLFVDNVYNKPTINTECSPIGAARKQSKIVYLSYRSSPENNIYSLMPSLNLNVHYSGERDGIPVSLVFEKNIQGIVIMNQHSPSISQIRSFEPGGSPCIICNNFIQYAENNLPNDTFACRPCRVSRGYKIISYLKSVGINDFTIKV